MCKICDEVVPADAQKEHLADHVEQEKQRRHDEKVADGVTPREKAKLDTDGVIAYLSSHEKGETVAGISTALSRPLNDVYKEIKVLIQQEKVAVVGENKIPGKRGRAAKIYGIKESV